MSNPTERPEPAPETPVQRHRWTGARLLTLEELRAIWEANPDDDGREGYRPEDVV